MDIQKVFDDATIEVSSIDQLKPDDLNECLRANKFCRIKGLTDLAAIKASRAKMAERFRVENDCAVYGEPASAVRDNFQKLSIGNAKHGGVNRPRFMRVFYNPIWSDDIFGLRETFIRTAQVRNLLGGHPIDFAIHEVEDSLWTAARIHHFPTGGGFMVSHRDTVLPAMLKESGIDSGYYQPLVLLSQKGVDYHTGGGIIKLGGEIVEYEDYAQQGDIVIYNAVTIHGVNDVDPDKPYRQDSLDGRMAGLVTVYKDLN
ncbi:MAG: hypothetical protein NXI22_15345 [bacterium]|nr:hypothetical protein [bacterium]